MIRERETAHRESVMLYIGGVYGGPEVTGSRIDLVIGKITSLLGDRRVDDSGSLDVVFHVPGSVAAPDYRGVRTGRLSKKERLLQVQIGVPPEIVSQDPQAVEAFVLDSLREAIRIAGVRFQKAKISYRHDEYERLLAKVEKALSPN